MTGLLSRPRLDARCRLLVDLGQRLRQRPNRYPIGYLGEYAGVFAGQSSTHPGDTLPLVSAPRETSQLHNDVR